MGTVVHPCRVKSFRKAVSAVMDDLELLNSIIEQLTPLPVANNLLIKLFQKCVCLVSTSRLRGETDRLGYVCRV